MHSIGRKIWVEERPFRIPLFGNIGVRMTIIQLTGGELVLISPVPLTEALVEELRKLGPVAYLVGPNSMHHLSLASYAERYPQAKLVGPRKLQKKRSDLKFQIELGDNPSAIWEDELQYQLISSKSAVDEVVFFHPHSRTLILTDLMFNIQQADSTLSRWMLILNGCFQKLTMTRIGKWIWKDRTTLSEQIHRISAWDFENVVVAHGDLVLKNGKQNFLESFDWLLGSKTLH